MEKQSAYFHLAKWFEYLNDDCGYENWSRYFILQLSAYPVKIGLDVGCGGGYFTRAFNKAGYQTTGMDVSAQMLSYAQEQALKEGVRGEYLLGDITKTKLPKRFDFVTAINDCFNYIPAKKLNAAFKNVGGALKKGGVFLFDVSSPRKFTNKIANTVSVDDRDDVTYMSFNKVQGNEVTLDVSLFIKRDDGTYERKDEMHVQYIHTEETLTLALKDNGFEIVSVSGHLGEDKTNSDRLQFICIKR